MHQRDAHLCFVVDLAQPLRIAACTEAGAVQLFDLQSGRVEQCGVRAAVYTFHGSGSAMSSAHVWFSFDGSKLFYQSEGRQRFTLQFKRVPQA